MNVAEIAAFETSAGEVFSTMLGVALSRARQPSSASGCRMFDISGVVGLSGDAAGAVVVSLERDLALACAERLLGARPTQINADVLDVVGELTNMIGGAAKARLTDWRLNLGLPSVIRGRNHVIQFPSSAPPRCVVLTSSEGRMSLLVSLLRDVAAAPPRQAERSELAAATM